MSSDYQREIIGFLKGYGATGVFVVPGGKHPSLRFEFKGKARRFTIAKTPSDNRATLNTIADLTRMLGPSDAVVPEAESRRLEDMLPEAKDKPRYAGRVALYTNTPYNRVRFYVPNELVLLFDLRGKRGDIAYLAKNT